MVLKIKPWIRGFKKKRRGRITLGNESVVRPTFIHWGALNSANLLEGYGSKKSTPDRYSIFS